MHETKIYFHCQRARCASTIPPGRVFSNHPGHQAPPRPQCFCSPGRRTLNCVSHKGSRHELMRLCGVPSPHHTPAPSPWLLAQCECPNNAPRGGYARIGETSCTKRNSNNVQKLCVRVGFVPQQIDKTQLILSKHWGKNSRVPGVPGFHPQRGSDALGHPCTYPEPPPPPCLGTRILPQFGGVPQGWSNRNLSTSSAQHLSRRHPSVFPDLPGWGSS